MKSPAKIKTLFLDIGGVLLTDGWQTASRKLAAKAFRLNFSEIDERHRMVFDTYEEGKLTLEEYLAWVVFYKKRSFTRTEFRKFMFAQSKPYPEMIGLVRQLKAKHGLKIIVLSNEARELNAYRIHQFKLEEFVDAFVSSCYVHLRKPDPDIFRLALDIAQTPAEQIVYLENTEMFIQIAEGMAFKASCTRIAGPLARNWLHLDCGMRTDCDDEKELQSRRSCRVELGSGPRPGNDHEKDHLRHQVQDLHGPRLEGGAAVFDQKRQDRPHGDAQRCGSQKDR